MGIWECRSRKCSTRRARHSCSNGVSRYRARWCHDLGTPAPCACLTCFWSCESHLLCAGTRQTALTPACALRSTTVRVTRSNATCAPRDSRPARANGTPPPHPLATLAATPATTFVPHLRVFCAPCAATQILLGGLAGDTGFQNSEEIQRNAIAVNAPNSPAGSIHRTIVQLPVNKTCNYCTLQWSWAARSDNGTCMCACAHARMRAYAYACMYACPYMCAYVRMCACACVHVWTLQWSWAFRSWHAAFVELTSPGPHVCLMLTSPGAHVCLAGYYVSCADIAIRVGSAPLTIEEYAAPPSEAGNTLHMHASTRTCVRTHACVLCAYIQVRTAALGSWQRAPSQPAAAIGCESRLRLWRIRQQLSDARDSGDRHTTPRGSTGW